MTAWEWTKSDEGYPALDASTAWKMYKGHALSPTEMLSRETVQNSGDAIAKFAGQNKKKSISGRIVFRFRELTGHDKAQFIAASGLNDLAARRAQYEHDPLEGGNALEDLGDLTAPLRLLYVEDYGATGLPGRVGLGMRSILFQAMYMIGGSAKDPNAGGSFGFGKSAMIAASRIHTVIAHTAFAKFGSDPCRSRLIGATWWTSQQEGDDLYMGRGNFGLPPSKSSGRKVAIPFEDDQATAIAGPLGFQLRDIDNDEELGTSFLIVDHVIEPMALKENLERYWWPALEDGLFDLSIVLPDGTEVVPQPNSNPFVAQFVRAYHIANGGAIVDPEREWRPSKGWNKRADIGELGVVYPDDPRDFKGDPGTDSGPIVALMRTPRMIIEYRHNWRSVIPLRGVFIASDDANHLLKATEPSAHESWTFMPSPGTIPAQATERAKLVLTRVQEGIRDTVSALTPKPPKSKESIPFLARLMAGIAGQKRGPRKANASGGEPIELTGVRDAEPVVDKSDDSKLRVEGRFRVAVKDSSKKGDKAKVLVTCALHVTEDDNPNGALWPVAFGPVGTTHDFVPSDDKREWTGTVSKTEAVEFAVESDPYPNLWTTTLQPFVLVEEWSDQ